jgi:hypothetical protein
MEARGIVGDIQLVPRAINRRVGMALALASSAVGKLVLAIQPQRQESPNVCMRFLVPRSKRCRREMRTRWAIHPEFWLMDAKLFSYNLAANLKSENHH